MESQYSVLTNTTDASSVGVSEKPSVTVEEDTEEAVIDASVSTYHWKPLPFSNYLMCTPEVHQFPH